MCLDDLGDVFGEKSDICGAELRDTLLLCDKSDIDSSGRAAVDGVERKVILPDMSLTAGERWV